MSMHNDNAFPSTRHSRLKGEPQTLVEWYNKFSVLPYHQMDWDLLKHLAKKEQKSYRQIAKDFKISRNTIKKYVNKEAHPARRPQPVRDQWRETVRNIWSYHSAQPDGDKVTAQWIFALLVEQHGYKGSERTIRTLILEFKEDQN
jgi:transcriptional antiterminator